MVYLQFTGLIKESCLHTECTFQAHQPSTTLEDLQIKEQVRPVAAQTKTNPSCATDYVEHVDLGDFTFESEAGLSNESSSGFHPRCLSEVS